MFLHEKIIIYDNEQNRTNFNKHFSLNICLCKDMVKTQGGESRGLNRLLYTVIRREPVSKSAIVFFKMNEISLGKVHILRNGML